MEKKRSLSGEKNFYLDKFSASLEGGKGIAPGVFSFSSACGSLKIREFSLQHGDPLHEKEKRGRAIFR